MDKKVCPNCSSENELSRYFCTNCGAFLEVEKYEEKNYLQHQLKFMRIVDNLRHMRLSENVPDELYAHYAEKMERYEAIYNLPEFPINGQLLEKIKEFLNFCRHPEFQIAFVGTIKTGKSTLINALLGDNYASMEVTPETAALTKFRYSPRDYVQVEFYSSEEWEELSKSRKKAEKYMKEYNKLNAESYKNQWLGHEIERKDLSKEEVKDELYKWSSSHSPEHFFVKEIEVGISTLPKDFPPQVVFVDTPGLYDPVAYRSELTHNYIKKANAVFVCVEAKKVNTPEIEQIAKVFSYSSNKKDKVHIVATHWDKLNYPQADDWKKQKNYLVNELNGEAFFETSEVANDNIISTSAYIYNLCRDFEKLDEQERKSLGGFAYFYDYDINDVSDRQKMMDIANINTVYKIIKNKLADNYKRLVSEEIKYRYITIEHDLARIAGDTREESSNLLAASSNSIDEFKEKAKDKKKDFDEIERVSDQLNKILDQVEASTARQMEAICADLRLKLNPGYKKPDEKKSKSNLHSIIKRHFKKT